MKRISNLAWSLIVLRFAFCIAGPARAYAATIEVNSLADTVANDKVCTLREAIEAANINMNFSGCAGQGVFGADTIRFRSDLNGTITLANSLPEIKDTLTIDGQPGLVNGNIRITISGKGPPLDDALFFVPS